MKHILASISFAAAAIFAAPVFAQTAAPAPAQPGGPERFASTMEEFAKADAAKAPPKCPIVFTGSSTIRRWTTLEKDMAPWPVLNRGFGGSQTADVNYYFDTVVKQYKPRAIVYYTGDNDINAGKTPYEVIANFKKFMSMKSRALGRMPVFVISNKPSKSRMAQFARQTEANFMLKEMAAKRSDLTYIDIVDPMLDKGIPKEIFVADGLHMTPEGYAIWTPIVRQAIEASGVLNKPCK